MSLTRIIPAPESPPPRELSRHRIEGTDVWLVRVYNECDEEEQLWAALDPPEAFVPAEAPECFIVAGSADRFAGLRKWREGLAKVSAELGGEAS